MSSSVFSRPLGGARVARRAVVGFCGSRSLGPAWSPLVASVVASVLAAGRLVLVGDAAGADSFVRRAAGPLCAVARVSPAARSSLGPAAFAARSVRLVRAVARRRFFSGSAFVGFVSSPCPAGVLPARRWSSGSSASGSWSSLALAAGWGVPVFVFWCAPGPPALPSSWSGSWVPAAPSGVWCSAWRFVPSASQAEFSDIDPSFPSGDPVFMTHDFPLRVKYFRVRGPAPIVREFPPQDSRRAFELYDAILYDPEVEDARLQVHCPRHGWTDAATGYCELCLETIN